MAVAPDTVETRFPTTDTTGFDTTTGDRTFTHTPSGTPKGVVVVIFCQSNSAPVTGVLYGGVAMTLSTSAIDSTEVGEVYIYTLVTSVPSGSQTVTLQGCIAASKFASCVAVTAATTNTTVDAVAKQDTTVSSFPTINIVTTATAVIVGGIHGGAAAPTSYAIGSGYNLLHNGDYGALSARGQASATAHAAGTNPFNFDFATSDDWCLACVAIAEAAAATPSLVYAPQSASLYGR